MWKTLTCDQALFSFRLVIPFLRKRETKNRILTSDPVRVNQSDAKIRPDRRLGRNRSDRERNPIHRIFFNITTSSQSPCRFRT